MASSNIVSFKLPILHLFSPYITRNRVFLPYRFVEISTSLQRSRRLSVVRAMQPSGVDGATPSEPSKSNIEKTNNDIGPVRSSGPSIPLPNIPNWARWVLGTIACLAIPFYKRIITIIRIEDKVEKTAETVVEVVEKVAEVVEKIASDVGDALPGKGSLKEAALKVEHIAEEVIKGAQQAGTFIHKVDDITDEVEKLVELPIIEEGEHIEKEIQVKEEVAPNVDLPKPSGSVDDH